MNPGQGPEPADEGRDPFLFDLDGFGEIVSEPVLKRGLAYFKENRVVELDCDGSRLWASVQGSQADAPYLTELSRDDDDDLWVQCDCDFDAEPVCKHAVAALLAYGARAGTPAAAIASAADAAVAERAQRGRSEVRVTHTGGEPWLGTWSATSVASATHHRQTYTVHIRSLDRRMNYCTCPDHATNQLGTCKHIEAVLHRLRRRKAYRERAAQPPTVSFVYLAWDVPGAPRIRVEAAARPGRATSALLARYFDARGCFSGRLPEDYFRFEEAARGRKDLLLGEDARAHVLRLAEGAAHAERAARIREGIAQWGGRLPGVRARLYSYQTEGVAFLVARGRALLADDMGLGKTLQAIAAASSLLGSGEVRRVLVVCPASLKRQWEREIERFTGHAVQVVQGPAATRGAQYRKGAPFTVVNYELVLRDLSVINETHVPDLLILDEAQRIKNWRTKVAASVKLIASRYAFVLTGTPLENRLEDLYSLLQVVDPGVLGPLWRYLLEFHVTDPRGKVIGYRNLGELRRRIAPVMLRRDRNLVRDQLPDRIEQRLDVPMTAAQRELHDAGLRAAATLAKIARRRPLTPTEQNRLMAALQQARMACNAAALVDPEASPGSPKLDELASLLDDLCRQGGQKAVVFSQWERMTAMVEQITRRLGLGSVRLHGGVPSARRGALIERFEEDDGVQVFISTDAGGVGLNLQAASVLVNLDIPWNPAVLEQRIARIHRLGQRETVQILVLVAADSYEERVLELVEGKQVLFDSVVGDEGGADVVGVSKRTLDTLLEDLSGDGAKPTAASGGAPLEDAAALAGPEETAAEPPTRAAPGEAPEDARLAALVEDLQAAFGGRLERVLGAGGGLLAVLDRVDPEAVAAAEALSAVVPVAVIEAATLAGLERLGRGSPLGETRVLLERAGEAAPPPGAAHRETARGKLRAAEVLLEQGCTDGVMDLLVASLLAAAAGRAGRARVPTMEEATVWVYAEAVPAGALAAEEAAAVTRAVSLREAPAIPEALLAEVLEDARRLARQAAG